MCRRIVPFGNLVGFRSKDQGDLDIDEFPPVHEFLKELFMKQDFKRESCEGQQDSVRSRHKRSHAEISAGNLADDITRNVIQRKSEHAKELQRKLADTKDAGRGWFDHFDKDKNGSLEKGELTNALFQTFAGDYIITREKITSTVDGVWDFIDKDGSGSVDFNEFKVLRDAVLSQLKVDRVNAAIGTIASETGAAQNDRHAISK